MEPAVLKGAGRLGSLQVLSTTSHFAISMWSWRRDRAAKTDAPSSGSLLSNSLLPIMWKSLPYGWVPCGSLVP